MAVQFEKGTAIATLSLTPLIDIVFLLLIFFLVATRFAEEDRELDVNLPDASAAMPLVVRPQELFVNIDAQGSYFVNDQQITSDELQAQIEQITRDNPATQSVIIRADERCDLGWVIKVINACNMVGVKHRLTAGVSGD